MRGIAVILLLLLPADILAESPSVALIGINSSQAMAIRI